MGRDRMKNFPRRLEFCCALYQRWNEKSCEIIVISVHSYAPSAQAVQPQI